MDHRQAMLAGIVYLIGVALFTLLALPRWMTGCALFLAGAFMAQASGDLSDVAHVTPIRFIAGLILGAVALALVIGMIRHTPAVLRRAYAWIRDA